MTKTTFGGRVTSLRKKLELSQQDLAQKVGTSGPIIGRYERDEIKPSIEVAKKIADALGVTLDYLTTEDDSTPGIISKDLLERMTKIENLPETEKGFVLYTLDALLRDAQAKSAYAKPA